MVDGSGWMTDSAVSLTQTEDVEAGRVNAADQPRIVNEPRRLVSNPVGQNSLVQNESYAEALFLWQHCEESFARIPL